jgi:hypothetical protein
VKKVQTALGTRWLWWEKLSGGGITCAKKICPSRKGERKEISSSENSTGRQIICVNEHGAFRKLQVV